MLPLDADNLLYPSGISHAARVLADAPHDVVASYGILERFDETGSVGVTSHLPWDVDLLVRRGVHRRRWPCSAGRRSPSWAATPSAAGARVGGLRPVAARRRARLAGRAGAGDRRPVPRARRLDAPDQ